MKFAVLLAFAVCLPAALSQTCGPIKDRLDCHPEAGATEANCVARGCSWCPAEEGQPWCSLPSGHGYVYQSHESQGQTDVYYLSRSPLAVSYFGNDFDNIKASFTRETENRLRIRIEPTDEQRFEVPIQINAGVRNSDEDHYEIQHNTEGLYSFKIVRTTTGSTVLDSSLGGLTFSDQFIQIGFKLPSTNLYGIGENEQHTYHHDFSKFATYALWARDQPPDERINMYGVQPHFTVLENNGDAFSVAIVNSNAQEFVVTPAPGLIYRTIGGMIDILVFLGPEPETVARDYAAAVGTHPIPPYWALGFQLSRWGYDKIENMVAAVERTADAGIPHDAQYGDIDIMDRRLDFTFDPVNFKDFDIQVKNWKAQGLHFVPIIDPGIAFEGLVGEYKALDLGNQLDIWVKRPDGTPVVGAVWPGNTYFPDFSNEKSYDWFVELLDDFRKVLEWDSIWIDMNEIASWGQGDIIQGCANNSINNPPYIGAVKNSLYDGTICPDAVQEYGHQYDTHSLYGWKWTDVTNRAMHTVLNGKRGFVVSRSTYLGTGAHGTHWTGDNFSNWKNLRASIIAVLQYNQFGVPFVGADICGFNDASNAKLCQRWMELGAFYPFSRNHNAAGTPDQDPGIWPEVAAAGRKSYLIRYTLLPYLYTLLFEHRITGSMVARPLWYEFPEDIPSRTVSHQFLWGSGLLISPVVYEDAVVVEAYFPPGKWYSYYNGEEISAGTHTLDAPLDFIPLHVRGGSILPTQEPAMNTQLARTNPFGLIVALDASGSASGELYYDDGDVYNPTETQQYFKAQYEASRGLLSSTVVENGYADMATKTLNNIRLFGVSRVSTITVNGQIHDDFLLIGNSVEIRRLNLKMTEEFEITWG